MTVKRKKNQPAATAGGRRRTPLAEQLAWFVVAATTIILPLVISITGSDVFRFPKDWVLEASALVLGALIVCARLLHVSFADETRWPEPVRITIVAVMLWSAVTTLISSNRLLSINSLLIVAAAATLFVASYVVIQDRSIGVIYLALAPAVINALAAIGQRTTLWNALPFDVPEKGRGRTIALLGNSNDVGMFLVVPALAAVALAIASKKHRAAATLIALVLVAGVLASETVGAIVALGAGLFAMLLPFRPRAMIVITLATIVVAMAMIRLSPTRWEATKVKIESAVHGDADRLLSGRLTAFYAAWRMFLRHPIFGVGLGCFPFHYFDEKIVVEMEHPELMDRHAENFGEVHNEHLQILAEGGLPAYAIFVGALIVLGRISFRTGRVDPGGVFAKRLAFPLALAIAVLTLSSFPLRIAAPTQNALFVCAITLAWSAHARD